MSIAEISFYPLERQQMENHALGDSWISTLVEGSRRGDAGALEDLVRVCRGVFYRFAMHMFNDPIRATRVVEAALRSVVNELRYLTDVAGVDRWLWGLICEQCLRAGTESGAWQLVLRSGVLSRAIVSLEESDRLAYLLHEMEGLDVNDLGWILEEDDSDVRSRLSRVRSAVYARLRDASA